MARDPVSEGLIRKSAQNVESWLRSVDDLSGNDGQWVSADEEIPAATINILKLIGIYHLPYLKANDQAIRCGEETFSITMQGQMFTKSTFKYQAKCYKALRDALNEISGTSADRLKMILEKTGCWEYLHL
jgi:hypothetical protein